jgi:hypothetical protein
MAKSFLRVPGTYLLLSTLMMTTSMRAQEPSPSGLGKKPDELRQPVRVLSEPASHQFWDKTNLALFAGVGVSRALDYTSTGYFRARRVEEGLLTNRIVENKPLFAVIEAAGVAASIGVAYWLHRGHRHKLERWVSIVHIGVSAFGDIRNYSLPKYPVNASLP